MKSKNLLYFLLFVFAFASNNTTVAQQVIVTDDASYTSPASGAMLDVKSTSKGFMPPRVALTSLTDVTTIASPATGLFVYCTGAAALPAGVYYWNGTIWAKALVGGSGGTNYLSIADDGTVTLNGGATTFDDLRVDGSRVNNSGTSAPSWAVFPTGTGLYANLFSGKGTDKQNVYFQVQLPHAWKAGSDIYPHVHWAPATAPGTQRVYWELEYQWVSLGSVFSTSSPTPKSGFEITKGSGTSIAQYEHVITPLGTITGSGQTISSVLICRLSRDAGNANDSYGDTVAELAALISVDFHYQIDSFGSGTDYTK